jgi:hypothetical protein
VPNLKNPGSLTSGILGAIGGKSPDGAASGGTAGKIGDVLGAITGRQTKPAPAAPQDGTAQQKPEEQTPPPSKEKQVEDAIRGLFGGRKK